MTFLTNFLKDGAVGAFLQSNENASADVIKESGPVENPKPAEIHKSEGSKNIIEEIDKKIYSHQCGYKKNKFAERYLEDILTESGLKLWKAQSISMDSPHCEAFDRFWVKVKNDPNTYIKDTEVVKQKKIKALKTWLADPKST